MICLTAFALALLVAKGGAISILTVENHIFHEHGHDDGWGEWSEWANCSRSCGGGVTFMKRECLRPRPGACEGPDKMYASCSITDCPVKAQDFRSFQCSQYNNITYRGRLYEWIPYTGAEARNPCELFCQPKSGGFFVKWAEKVVDGTRCKSGEFDVCVDGACENVGCDMLLGSELEFDVCRECGGNGSSCYLVQRTVTAKLPSGYVPLIIIPPGATNIVIQEKRASKNFLAVKDSGKRYVLNGHWQINSSSVVHVAGSDLVYKKSSNRKKAQESIEIIGPISEMLYVDILVQDRNRGIEYSFYLPTGMEDINYNENGWFAEAWHLCSVECGGGVQKRKVVCKNNNSRERVLNYLCYTQERPESTRTCNTQSCGASWLIGDWDTCSKQCGGGVQTRQVMCIQNTGLRDRNAPRILLDDEECTDSAKPETQRTCAENPCPHWTTSSWSECSTTCGEGVKHRDVSCSSAENPCDNLQRPESEKSCNLGPCSGIHWVTTKWSQCVGGCGTGIQTRDVTCGSDSQVHYPESLCNIDSRPPSIQSCSSSLLCPDRPTWIAEDWSECSVSCGYGYQNRRVVCGLYEVESYRILSDDNCVVQGNAEKPSSTQECFAKNCTVSWYIGLWTPCSSSCGSGVRSRVVLCVNEHDDVIDDDACGFDTRPADFDICFITGCDVDSNALSQTRQDNDDCQGDACFEVVSPTAELQVKKDVDVDSENCLLDQDPGDCDHWTVYWYFDRETRRCDRFWYGGCGGNANKFETSAECSRICNKFQSISITTTVTSTRAIVTPPTVTVLPTQTSGVTTTPTSVFTSSPETTPNLFDVGDRTHKPTVHLPPPLCFLRRSAGPCQFRIRRWFFDGSTGKCVEFFYGGCGGNENNFDSKENCAFLCGNEKIMTFTNTDDGELPNTPPVAVHIKPGRSEVQVQIGEMARLACMADGSPKPTVTWGKAGQDDRAEIERGEILEDYSLLISKIAAEDQGTYECTASNGYGPDQTWKVKLVVKDRLLIHGPPSDISVHVGEPAALRCRFHDDVIFVTWYKDGEKVRDNEFYVTQPWGDLHILQAKADDSGTYTCSAYSADASQSASAKLLVSPKEQVAVSLPIRPAVTGKHRRPSSVKQCRDYPEYANCNIVVLKNMCHKHDFARYCCASCGGEPSTPPLSSRRRVPIRRRNSKR